MRLAIVLFALATAAPAKDDARYRDEAWGIAYAAPGLRPTLGRRATGLLFTGRAAHDLRIEIRVHELDAPADAVACRKKRQAEIAGKRKLAVKEDGATSFLYRVRKYGVFEEQHGHAFVARGHHCFEVHAWVDDRAEGSTAAIRAALGGLAPDADPGMGLRVVLVAGKTGRDPLDPRVLLGAGASYVEGGAWGPPVPALAARVLARARARAKPDTFEPKESWNLLWTGGRAHLAAGDAGAATTWLAAAEKAAVDPAQRARAGYDLARAAAGAGDLDLAFAALDRAFDGEPPATRSELSHEKTLETLRKDPRWEDFWRRRVAGSG